MGHSYYSVPLQSGNFQSKTLKCSMILSYHLKEGMLNYKKNILVQLRILYFNNFDQILHT